MLSIMEHLFLEEKFLMENIEVFFCLGICWPGNKEWYLLINFEEINEKRVVM